MAEIAYGHEIPRIYTPPLRKLTPETTLGYSMIEFAEVVLNITLLPWQRWLLIHAFELQKPLGSHLGMPRLRFRTILILVGRQNGKSLVSRIVILYFMFIKQVALVLGTAQSLGIAESLWEQAVDMLYASDALADSIIKVHRANGGKKLVIDAGDGLRSEYQVASASRRGGRGLTGDLIVLDELREQTTFEAWAAITKTLMTRAEGLVFCITNAGDSSSVVLEYLRDMAHRMLGDPDHRLTDMQDFQDDEAQAVSASLGIFEWSAPPEADPSKRETWAYANPSAGYLIEWSTIEDAYLTDPPDVFMTECLCQWVTRAGERPFPGEAWESARDDMSQIAPDAPLIFGVDVCKDRKHASIVVCGQRADGNYHVELVAYMSRMSMVEAWFRRRVDSYGGHMTVCLQGRGSPASSLISSLQAIPGIEVIPCQGDALTASCAAFYDAIAILDEDESPTADDIVVYHLSQPGMDIAAECAAKRTLGDGAWAWDRKRSPEDISPICAATWAYGLASGIYDGLPMHKGKVPTPSAMHTENRTRAMLFV